MTIESACVPLPSEIIMPFAGYLVSTGRFSLWAVAVAGALGNGAGSAIAYAGGRFGGRPLILRYGRYLLVRAHDVDAADRWFARYGPITTFVCRLLPIVRTFISFPAGMARMSFPLFLVLSVLGSFPWCLLLAWIGRELGERWDTLGPWFHRFDVVIVGAILSAVALVVVRARRGAGDGRAARAGAR